MYQVEHDERLSMDFDLVQGVWGKWVQGYGAHGQWGTGVWGTWAMGYRGMGHMGNGVHRVWAHGQGIHE